MMEVFTASEVKQAFGEVLLKAQKAPVGINKNGKPVAVMVSAEDFEQYQKDRLKMEIEKGMASVRAGRLIESAEVIAELRQQIVDA